MAWWPSGRVPTRPCTSRRWWSGPPKSFGVQGLSAVPSRSRTTSTPTSPASTVICVPTRCSGSATLFGLEVHTVLVARHHDTRTGWAHVTTIRAAAVQLRPVLYSREGTVERVVAKIDELATQGVQFATFPETIVPYYPYFSFVQAPYQMLAEQVRLLGQAVSVPSSATQSIGDAASRAGMVVS